MASQRPDSLPLPFSEASLQASRARGAITGDEQKLLRAIGRDPHRLHVYDSAQPLLLLRDPQQSAGVRVPRLSEVNEAKVKFGAQAVSRLTSHVLTPF